MRTGIKADPVSRPAKCSGDAVSEAELAARKRRKWLTV